jgi:Skp family chaperone for outer membrane proteins
MSQSPTWWRALVLSTIVLCIVFAVRASGDDKKNGTFATVDLVKLQQEFKAKAAVEGEIASMQGRLERALQRRDAMPLLTEEEHKELDQLVDKDISARNDKEKKRIEEITTKGNTLSLEATKLRQRDQKDLSEADKKKINENEQAAQKTLGVINSLRDDGTNKLKQFINTNSETLMAQIRKAVGKIAEQKNISLVFNSEVALYAGTDITPQVVTELNKK